MFSDKVTRLAFNTGKSKCLMICNTESIQVAERILIHTEINEMSM